MTPALTGLLEPGEHPLAITPLIQDPGTTDVSLADAAGNLLDRGLLIGGAHPGALLQRAAFGRVAMSTRFGPAVTV